MTMNLIWLTSAEHLNDYMIKLVFSDGKVKIVNLESHLDQPVFQPLRESSYFKKFTLNPFTIEWENGADFAPEFLYSIGQ
ncbi:MAG TPA: DUF2442 domain-containing protein [Prolixibacteraceae bacterium]|nr:DUF2442 domain-containing protein [Prolixibacteraceae bacterium]